MKLQNDVGIEAAPWLRDEDYGWFVVFVSLVFQAVSSGVVIYSFTFWVRPWVEEFDQTRGEVLVATTLLILSMGFFSPFVGRWLDQRRIWKLVTLGAILLAISLYLVSRSTALWQILLVYCSSLALGTVLTGSLPAQTLAARWFPRRQGLAIGLVTIGTSIGGFAMPPIVVSLLTEHGWRTAHLILGLAMLMIVPPVWLVLRREPVEADTTDDENSDLGFRKGDWKTLDLLRNRTFWIIVLGFTPLIAVFNSLQFNMAGFAGDAGFPAIDAAYLVSLLAISMLIGKVFFGALADHVDLRLLYWISVGAAIGSALLFLIGERFYLLAMGAIALGLSGGGLLPIKGAMFAQRFGHRSFGQVVGLAYPFIMTSALVPPVAGWVRDTTGSFEYVFLGIVLFMTPLALVMIGLPKNEPYTDQL